MEMEKKNVAIIILAIALIASGVGNIILVLQPTILPPTEKESILFGNMYIAEDIDPMWSWDSASFDAELMVWECLVAYNLSDPSLALIPMLATDLGEYNTAGDELTFQLKQGVKFHDGTDFNADAVVWSFNRLAYLMNVSGTLPSTVFYGIPTIVHSLYELPDTTPVIDSVVADSEYQVTFHLQRPYGPFLALLSFPASCIMSPTSTPELDYIDPSGDVHAECIGTGPMKIERLETYEVRFSKFDDYHREPIAFDTLVHVKIEDADARNMAVLSGAVDIITDPHPTYFEQMDDDDDLILWRGGANSITQYVGMNNKILNQTMRDAISYAINYTYIIDNLLLGQAVRMKSVVPPGIPWANDTFNVPVFDIPTARGYMQDMGFGVTLDTAFPGPDDTTWNTTAFLTINYTYNMGNLLREQMFPLLEENLQLIGILVEDAGLQWQPFKDRFYDLRQASAGYDALQIWFVGWMPDYADAQNFIDPLWSNVSDGNACQVNDAKLQGLIQQGLDEVDPDVRRPIYWEIQKYMAEELHQIGFCYHGLNRDCHDKYLKGFTYNPFGYNNFYGAYWDYSE